MILNWKIEQNRRNKSEEEIEEKEAEVECEENFSKTWKEWTKIRMKLKYAKMRKAKDKKPLMKDIQGRKIMVREK